MGGRICPSHVQPPTYCIKKALLEYGQVIIFVRLLYRKCFSILKKSIGYLLGDDA